MHERRVLFHCHPERQRRNLWKILHYVQNDMYFIAICAAGGGKEVSVSGEEIT